MNGELLPEVLKGMEPVGSIEVFVVLSVRTFHFAVVPRCVGTDELMPYPQLFEARLKEGKFSLVVFIEGFGELRAVVCLDTLYLERESIHEHFEELYRGVCTLFLESGNIAIAGILVYGGVLEEMFFHNLRIARDADGRNNFYVNLHSFSRIMHWFIWFRNIFGVRRLYRLEFLSP